MSHFDLVRLAALVRLNPSDVVAVSALVKAVEVTQGILPCNIQSEMQQIRFVTNQGDSDAARQLATDLNLGSIVSDTMADCANAVKNGCDYQLCDALRIWSVGLDDIAPDLSSHIASVDIKDNQGKIKSEASFCGDVILYFEDCAQDWFELHYMDESGESDLNKFIQDCLGRFFDKHTVGRYFFCEIDAMAKASYQIKCNIEEFSDVFGDKLLGCAAEIMTQQHKDIVDGSAYETGLDPDDSDYDSQSRGFNLISLIERATVDLLAEMLEHHDSIDCENVESVCVEYDLVDAIHDAMWKLWERMCELECENRSPEDWNTNGSWFRMLDF